MAIEIKRKVVVEQADQPSYEIFVPGSTPDYERALIYGDPKCGKTRLATAFARLLSPKGKILYIASDPASESLKSVLPQYRDRIIVLKPKVKVNPNDKFDPLKMAWNIATKNWKEDYPDMECMIWDTLTASGRAILSQLADSEQFSDKHVQIATPYGPVNIPMEGDYGSGQRIVSRMMDGLLEQPYHVIVLCHAGTSTDKDGVVTHQGPQTIGKATMSTFPGLFNPVIYMAPQSKSAIGDTPGSTKYIAYTETQGRWPAGIRQSSSGGNVLAKVTLQEDPGHFWDTFNTNYR